MKRKVTYTRPRNNLKDRDFGRWHVLAWEGCKKVKVGKTIRTRSFWRCECACGTVKSFAQDELRKIKDGSCGCLKLEKMRADRGSAHRGWKGHGGISGTLWYSIQKDALRRSIEFKITIEYAWKIFRNQQCKCALTGLPLTLTGEGRGRGTASLDRIDNTKGYVQGNVQWLHKDINIMKHTHTVERFLELCALVCEHRRQYD